MNSAMSSKDSDDDEVVFEADVYLSKALEDSLYLFHYPTRNSQLQDELNCLSAKIKPKQKKVELEIGLDTHSDNYDRSRGEQMAYNVDGQNANENSYYKNSLMDKYMLLGNSACSSSDSYALGLLQNGELHITPLHTVVELRPEFSHMDKIDTQSKKAMETEEESDEEEAVAVTVRFEGPNAEKERKIKEKSYQYLQNQSASEAWINVNYHKLGSHRSKSEFRKLICSQAHKDVTTDSFSAQEYLKDLVPECLRLSGYQTTKDEETAILADKPLSDQMRHLLTHAHVVRFSTLLQKLKSLGDSSAIERLVQQVAVLVQGCWVVKSELLYKEDSVSSLTGISSKLLINARDFVIWLFTKSNFIVRKEVLSAIYIPDEDFKSMIQPIANKTNRGWEFKFSFDHDFVESHPAIQQSQEIKWNLRYKKLVKDLNIGMIEAEGEQSKILPIPRPRVKRHSRSSMSEDGEESGTDSTAGTSRETKPKRSTPKKRSVPSSPTKAGPKTKPYPIATLDISPTFLESSLPENTRTELRELVGEAIRAQYCMTLSEIGEIVLGSHLSTLVHRSDFEKVVEEALIECGAQKLKNKWPQNTTPEILFAFCNFGNKFDRYRATLLDLFSTTARTRPNLFMKKVQDELREIISEADCRQIFYEYCVHKSGFYYLKGTIPSDS